jgi:hypothetical protein
MLEGMSAPFTDEEFAFLRFARFGELPERVLPSEWVALQDPPPLVLRQTFDTGDEVTSRTIG